MKLLRIFINTQPYYLYDDESVFDTITYTGIKLPRLCYHDSLNVAGNCRICLVEVSLGGKFLVSACTLYPLEDIEVFTHSIAVLKARENVMETLLFNHPLDCPICDQAGECDLQDHSKAFGGTLSRFFMSKRKVESKVIDPCIKTIMTRCIHCTRCIRYFNEITNVYFLGTIGRGVKTEIGTYINYNEISSESSGNVVDLCPVGALTPKPYAYKSRAWEIIMHESIDLYDGFSCPIYINTKELLIVNVLPKPTEEFFGQWISNKTRFGNDSNTYFRIIRNYHYQKQIKIEEIYKSTLNKNKYIVIINEEIDCNTLINLTMCSFIRSNNLKLYRNSSCISFSNSYINLLKNKKELNEILRVNYFFFATSLRMECANLNILLRKKMQEKYSSFYHCGFRQQMDNVPTTLCYNITFRFILGLIKGKKNKISTLLYQSISNLIIFIGESLLQRMYLNRNQFTYWLYGLNETNSIFFINQKKNTESLIQMCNYSLNFKKISKKQDLFIVSYNQENSLETQRFLSDIKNELIWFNTHAIRKIHEKCAYTIPVKTYYEQDAIFINLEKRPQKSSQIIDFGKVYVNESEALITIDYLLFTNLGILKHNISMYQEVFKFIDDLLLNSEYYETIHMKKSIGLYVKNRVRDQINKSKVNKSTYIKINRSKKKVIKVKKLYLVYKKKSFYFYNFKNKSISYKYSKYPFKPVISNFFLVNNNSNYSLHMQKYSLIAMNIHNIFKKRFLNKRY